MLLFPCLLALPSPVLLHTVLNNLFNGLPLFFFSPASVTPPALPLLQQSRAAAMCPTPSSFSSQVLTLAWPFPVLRYMGYPTLGAGGSATDYYGCHAAYSSPSVLDASPILKNHTVTLVRRGVVPRGSLCPKTQLRHRKSKHLFAILGSLITGGYGSAVTRCPCRH